jgi:uncharacterized repeat protein (TIGR03803 family)
MQRYFVTLVLLLAASVSRADQRLMMTTVVPSSSFSGSVYYHELTQGNDGLLYGVDNGGGAFGKGSYFKTTLDGAITFVPFDGTNGASPIRAPLQAPDGNFYGTATVGGVMNNGTVYQIDTNGVLRTIYSFDGTNGSDPSDLVFGKDGALYGFTSSGGIGFDGTLNSGDGVVFKVTTNGIFTRLASFSETNLFPDTIVDAGGGYTYGTTGLGGEYGLGTVFRMTPNGQLTTLVAFNGTNGLVPRSLVLGSDGFLYGVTDRGGNGYTGNSDGWGTVFKLSTNGDFATLRFFSFTDAAWPRGRLIEVTNGLFYGTAYWGGQNAHGAVFQITSDGQFADLLQFQEYWGRGTVPFAGVTKGSDGNYYGTTSYPSFNIYCLRPIEAPVLQSAIQNGQITLNWKAWGGLSYGVSYRTNLNEPDWHYLAGASIQTNGIISYSEPIDLAGPRFYKAGIYIPERWW